MNRNHRVHRAVLGAGIFILLALPVRGQEEVNKAVWMRSMDEIFNAQDLSVIDELYAEDLVMVQENGMGVVAGPAG